MSQTKRKTQFVGICRGHIDECTNYLSHRCPRTIRSVILDGLSTKKGIDNGLKCKQDKGVAPKLRYSGPHRTAEPTDFPHG